MGFFSFLFGTNINNIQDYLKKGAVILDVRTQREYETNNIYGAIHIPISELGSRISEIKHLRKPVVVYCASGIRSAQATHQLKSQGIDAMNGGGISNVKKALQ